MPGLVQHQFRGASAGALPRSRADSRWCWLLARRQIAGTLRGIICQKLIPSLDGNARFAAHEILSVDSVVRNLILDTQNEKIQAILEGSADSHSISFNKDIYRLIKAGKISKADGLKFSPNPQALEMNLKGIFIKT